MKGGHPEGDKEGDQDHCSAATVNIPADNNAMQQQQQQRKHKSTRRSRTTTSMHKGDRSKTLFSGPRKRARMNDKLYELRALVPNITKKDKASIIGGATLYMQELQMRAKKLEAHIVSLEESEVDKTEQPSYQTPQKISAVNSYSSTSSKKIANTKQPSYQTPQKISAVNPYSSTSSKKIAKMASLEESEVDKPQQPSCQTPTKIHAVDSCTPSKKIANMEVALVGERGVYVKLVCNKGHGVAVSLYNALESFTSLNVESSKLVTVPEGFELTFTLKVGKLEANLEKLKLWVAGAFLNCGFDFKTSPQP